MKKTICMLSAVAIMATGCANYRPHTKAEKYWLGGVVAGQLADGISTKAFLRQGIEELNPRAGKNPSDGTIFLFKAGAVGIIYGLGQIDPDNRMMYYKIGAFLGFAPAVWNYYQLVK